MPVVTTRRVRLLVAEWSDLGPGPVLLGVEGDGLHYALSSDEPDLEGGFLLKAPMGPVRLDTDAKIWARPASKFMTAAIVAPIGQAEY